MPTRKRSKTTRNRKTRRSHMRPMRPMRPMKNLSIPLGYFGSIQINRRSDNGIDFIFNLDNLGKKVHGGAKLLESRESIKLVSEVMDFATQSIVRNIQEKLNSKNSSNSNFIQKYPPMGKGPFEYIVYSTKNNASFINISSREQVKYPTHISMFLNSEDSDFLLQSRNKGHDTRYHITEDSTPKQHFNLEWHISYDPPQNNFYLECKLINPPYSRENELIAKELITYINEALLFPENRISAVNETRKKMYINDTYHRIILQKYYDNKTISQLIGDTSEKHTIHGIPINSIIFPGGSYTEEPIFNSAVQTATDQYNGIIARLTQQGATDKDVKKDNKKQSEKKQLTKILKSFTAAQQKPFFEILSNRQLVLESTEAELAELEAELAELEAKLAKLEAETNGGSDKDDDLYSWETDPIVPINIKGQINPIEKLPIEKLKEDIAKLKKYIAKLKEEIVGITTGQMPPDTDLQRQYTQFTTQNAKSKQNTNNTTNTTKLRR